MAFSKTSFTQTVVGSRSRVAGIQTGRQAPLLNRLRAKPAGPSAGIGIIRRWIKWAIRYYGPRRLTEQEIENRRAVLTYVAQRRTWLREREEAYQRWINESTREAMDLARLMSNKLGQLDIDYVYSIGEGQKRQKLVQFEHIIISPDQYAFKVNTWPGSLPHGVNEVEMTQDEILRGLELTTGKPTTFHMSPDNGFWYLLDRESGLRNIPVRCYFKDVYQTLGAKDDLLTIPLGLGENRVPIKINLQTSKTPHLLIAGASGMGKTNGCHVIINALARRDPAQVRLALVDLKMIEFPIYDGLPHLVRPIVTTADGFIEMISWLRSEVERRMQLIGADKRINNIKDYNAKRKMPERLHYLVVVMDEFASFMINPSIPRDIKNEIEDDLAFIASIGRAPGVHLILATQRPEKDVIRPLISANFSARIGYGVASITNSILIVGDGSCFFGDNPPEGRAILAVGARRIPFQCALAARQVIDETITNATSGKFTERKLRHDVTMAEMAQFCIDHFDGYWRSRKLYDEFKQRGVTQPDMTEFTERYKSERFLLNGKPYRLTGGGRRGADIKIEPELETSN